MKKLFLLATIALIASSCFKFKSEEDDPVYEGYLQTIAVVNQTTITLDPFNIAFRLNVLLNEGDGNANDAPPQVWLDLFGLPQYTAISKEGGVYTFSFLGGSGFNDRTRIGKLSIDTGNKSLSEVGARWIITTDATDPYRLYLSNGTLTIFSQGYVIETVEKNKWDIHVSGFVASSSLQSSAWSCVMTMQQDSGEQTTEYIGNTTYSLWIEADGSRTIAFADILAVSTESPLRMNGTCLANPFIGTGELRIWNTDDPVKTYTKAQWQGESLNYCDAEVEITYKGDSNVYK